MVPHGVLVQFFGIQFVPSHVPFILFSQSVFMSDKNCHFLIRWLFAVASVGELTLFTVIPHPKNPPPTFTGHTYLIPAPPLSSQYPTLRLYTGPDVSYPISASMLPPSDIPINTHAIIVFALFDIIFPVLGSNPVTIFPGGTTLDCDQKYSFMNADWVLQLGIFVSGSNPDTIKGLVQAVVFLSPLKYFPNVPPASFSSGPLIGTLIAWVVLVDTKLIVMEMKMRLMERRYDEVFIGISVMK